MKRGQVRRREDFQFWPSSMEDLALVPFYLKQRSEVPDHRSPSLMLNPSCAQNSIRSCFFITAIFPGT